MEVRQGSTPAPQAAAVGQENPQPQKVKEQETRRAIGKAEETATQDAKRDRERQEAENRAAEQADRNGGVNVRV